MTYHPEKPYNQLPLLPPKVVLENIEVLKVALKATRALGELKGSGRSIPNQSILINAIALQEAKESSEIENIFTTHDDLYQAFENIEKAQNPQTKEVLRYQQAVWHGYQRLRERPLLTTNVFVELVQIIKQNQAGIRTTPGTYIRDGKGNIIYTPPEGEHLIRDLLQNLEDYIHQEDDIDSLIKMAVIHYQFEAIHPFTDGNGRTGRIINILYLIAQGLIELPVLYLSKYIIDQKSAYYQLLRKVTEENAWHEWIIYVLEGVTKMAEYTRQKIEAIYELKTHTGHRLRKEVSFFSLELLELLFLRPYIRISHLEEGGIAKRKTASEYLYKLSELKVLEPKKIGRDVLFINAELMRILKS